MPHVQPLLLLYASLFFLPFACAVDFLYCNNVGYGNFGTVTGLEISPNPVGPSDERFEISLSFLTSSTAKSFGITGTLDVSIIYNGMHISVMSSHICAASGGVCPLEPSKDYVVKVSLTPSSIFQNPKYVLSLNAGVEDIAEPEKLCIIFDLPTS